MPMQFQNNITEKSYRKLTLRVATNGFSYAVTDTLNHSVITTCSISFEDFPKTRKTEEHFARAFADQSDLSDPYDEIIVLHDNNLNTLVPNALFDEEFAGSYLQFNTKVFESDFFAHDNLEKNDVVNVYIPYVNINNYLIDQFGPFEYKHASSILIPKLLDYTKNNDVAQMFVHFGSVNFEIIVAQNRKLLLFNSFEYQTPADFVYYLLFTAEQLRLNPEHFPLHILGDLDSESEFYQLAYKYVRHIRLLDTSAMGGPSEEDMRRHFILYNS
jgi:hypothetical protein